jgi:hypothetical protein
MSMNRYLIDWYDDQDSQFSAEVIEFFEPYWKHDFVYAQVNVAGTRMSYDYVNTVKKIILEVDGEQHQNPLSFRHGGSNAKWLSQVKRDDLKDRMAAANGYTMIRITPEHLPLTKAWVEKTFDVAL